MSYKEAILSSDRTKLLREIAEEVGCSTTKVWYHLDRAGLELIREQSIKQRILELSENETLRDTDIALIAGTSRGYVSQILKPLR